MCKLLDASIQWQNTNFFLQSSKSSSYGVDWDNPCINIRHNDGSVTRKSDFAISLEALVEAKENTGFLATVKRSIDLKTQYVISLFV